MFGFAWKFYVHECWKWQITHKYWKVKGDIPVRHVPFIFSVRRNVKWVFSAGAPGGPTTPTLNIHQCSWSQTGNVNVTWFFPHVVTCSFCDALWVITILNGRDVYITIFSLTLLWVNSWRILRCLYWRFHASVFIACTLSVFVLRVTKNMLHYIARVQTSQDKDAFDNKACCSAQGYPAVSLWQVLIALKPKYSHKLVWKWHDNDLLKTEKIQNMFDMV